MQILIFPQTFSFTNSLLFVIGISTILFVAKYLYISRKLAIISTLPSILIIKSKPELNLIEKLSSEKITTHPESSEIMVGLSGTKNGQVQFLEIPFSFLKDKSHIFSKINLKGFVVATDNTETFKKIEKGIREIETLDSILRDKKGFMIVGMKEGGKIKGYETVGEDDIELKQKIEEKLT